MVEEFDALQWHCKHSNPDFAADPARLLREMERHPDGPLFFAKLIYRGNNVEAIDDDGLIPRKYIIKPGLLLKEVAKWFRGKEKP